MYKRRQTREFPTESVQVLSRFVPLAPSLGELHTKFFGVLLCRDLARKALGQKSESLDLARLVRGHEACQKVCRGRVTCDPQNLQTSVSNTVLNG